MTHVITKFNNERSPQSKPGEKFKIRNIFGIFISLLILNLLVTISNAAPVFTNNDAMTYFEKYGSLNRNSPQNDAGPQSMMDMSSLIKEFQAFSGIPVTGELDEKTVEIMMSPRCGVSDTRPVDGQANNYVLHWSKWGNTNLSYRIYTYPHNVNDLGGRGRVNSEIEKAFALWENVADLNFKKVFDSEPNIEIRFESGDHGDEFIFFGPGNDLAHAFYPAFGGDVHFDDDETWSIASDKGVNLLLVAAHEFGHSLGLMHSGVRDALMAPHYQGYNPKLQLHSDDIAAIQKVYGARKSLTTPSIPTQPSPTRSPSTVPSTTSQAPQTTTRLSGMELVHRTTQLIDKVIKQPQDVVAALNQIRWNGTHVVPSNSSCLKKGTKIFMADMSEKPVELLQIGDIVLDKDMRPTRVLGISYEFLLEQKFYGFDNKSFFFTNSHLFAGPSVEDDGDLRLYAKSTKTLFHNNPLMKYLNVSDMGDHEKLQLYHHDGKNSVSVRNVTVSQDPQEYLPETPIYFIQVDSPTGTYIANGYVCRHEIPPIELWPNTMSILFRLMETEAFQKISQLPYTLETISGLHNVISQVVNEVKLVLERSELSKGKYERNQEIMRLEDVAVEESIGKIFGNPTLSTAGVNLYARVGSIISQYLDDIEESKWKVEGRQVGALQSDLYVVMRNELEKYF